MHNEKPAGTSGETRTGREINPQPIDINTPTRGSSIQGEHQGSKGGPAGANQGGAPRGSSRLEPSHQKRQDRQERSKK